MRQDWRIFDDAEAVARATAERILDSATQAIETRGQFKLVLAGGTTPAQAYRLLRAADADWGKWFIYFGDERCLPADHPERNSVMAGENWLAHMALPAENIFPIPTEEGIDRAVEKYTAIVETALPFDLVLLGMGEDGHTASLFPGHPLDALATVVAVHDAPKPPPQRVSLGLAALNAAREVLIIVTGRGKQAAVQCWQAGEDLPIAHVHGQDGVDVYIDSAAVGDV
ncbi:6-phosphogluconolactonase, eukaryotic type [hydrothermal vent metagenome]|uniref:6-phosphogluconolactonase, eukaryotic type n=1 Tax=hydrothermal vent metagenome TaxID=652676 RepID=A0A3B1AGG8_9ZZZZ